MICRYSSRSTGQWLTISFKDHEKYLYTLGNLTLTFDNQSLINKEFSEKKQILLNKSRIMLNNELVKSDDFNANTIKIRSIDMLDKFLCEFLETHKL